MTGNEDALGLSQRLSQIATDALTSVLAPGEPVALVDFPYSDNFGDAAIWQGQNVLLNTLGHTRRYVCDIGRYDPDDLRRMHPEGPILLHGGGNFGDYWPEHQELRERVLRDFPDRVIVQLPQSVGFRDSRERARVASAMGDHRAFTLLARDRSSLQQGEDMGLRTRLCPDSATHMGPLPTTAGPTRDLQVLARTDHESGGLRELVSRGRHQSALTEWAFDQRGRRVWTAAKAGPRVARRLPGQPSSARSRWQPVLSRTYDLMAKTCVDAAVRQLSGTRVLVTDRLHAHVIATLMGIPNIVVDNNYGKVRTIFDAFTHTSAVAKLAGSPAEAMTMAEDLIASGDGA
ncbi:polysaccharide pyruvyl transferase family protein [Nocardioides flavescens]|uniref:Polysaccharide pyruvyl transferase n=1 Tax=Nocardioides flavescens TaxID=2691959 RepID=A0A6L7F129_9ACTN|nr:polysaccharide pyruvyl transferase family protein [Nocardioides flavescens]MXG89972.1 polysaccharide pyruvyl transferase [Nocardioides flavescens]